MKKHIPNLITTGNLLCGLTAIYLAFHQQPEWAAIAIGIAAIFDFLDGMTARLLHAYSEIGKQLDSLADLVSFGVAPGFIMMHMMANSPCVPSYFLATFVALLLPIAAAWRLAKFNTDSEQESNFKGLPTPAAAMLVAALPFVVKGTYALPIESLQCYPKQVALTLAIAYAMMSSWPLFSLKFKNMSWQDNKIRYIFLIISLILIPFMGITSLLAIIGLYIILSIVDNRFIGKKDTV